MRQIIMIAVSAFSIAVISGCSAKPEAHESREHQMGNENHSTMNATMMEGHMSHDNVVHLNDSTGEHDLKIPPLLQRDPGEEIVYTVRAQKGETELFDGIQTKTYGYNGTFLGPMISVEKGEIIKIKTINELDEPTTFHWHGLKVAGDIDGGPHDPIQPDEERVIEFQVAQDAATLWFHPHPEGNTAAQVYNGLAGLLYIQDEKSEQLGLPSQYGENDFPLLFQDRLFDDQKQLNYEAAQNSDGTIGDTLLVNGTLNPKLTVPGEHVRFRLLNGSNARNFTFKLNTGEPFVQIATDGGLLNKPIQMSEITLTPSERAEIVIDFSSQNNKMDDLALVNEDGSILLPFDVADQHVEKSTLPDEMNDFALTEEEKSLPVSKKVELFGMMEHVTINGKKFDPNRIDFTQKQGVTEVWEIYNKPDMMGGMIHPFHIHGTQFKVISRNGKEPPENERGWKDSISVKPDERVKIAVQFKDKGIYMFHCHILEHEDNGMMGQIKVE
ncbi:multicopper oxidase family protein [Sporosarcina sp. Te-1]|uniref:multicopper oxidase family protein n=1 Tax=Sporosarcina sp. Te-1 TaxID=2818390 RepID=UPI001A9E8A2E|nr:multicopper oxidase domain-containing protein [Sporosarcina sp. Te-1]QTD41001.1 multicopper oxidase domain-containing protein [Sporosarcina sp. Te-1]